MKKYFLSFLYIVLCIQLSYAQHRSKVDERFELTSTVFALAGVPAYCQCEIPQYRNDIFEFTRYEQTEPINFVRELHQLHSITHAAVSTTTAMLEIKEGEIRLQPQYDISEISEWDSRWNEALFIKYLELLNVFYKESNFHKFFEEHRALYDCAEERMDAILDDTIAPWFESFYGKSLNNDLTVYVSLMNGPNNYAVPNGVLIGIAADAEGQPAPNEAIQFSLLHEFGHHYTNSLFETFWPQMKPAADKIYSFIHEQMAQMAYGSASESLGEWLNNLLVLMYYRENNPDMLAVWTNVNKRKGFIWMEQSVNFMNHFYANRTLYPTIKDFMPQLVGFLNDTADNFDSVIREAKAQPYIINVYPALGANITGFDEIIITFSEPMLGAYGFSGTGIDDPNVKFLYIVDDIEKAIIWSEDRCQARLILDTTKAETNCKYGVRLHPSDFLSAKRALLSDNSNILFFNTGQK